MTVINIQIISISIYVILQEKRSYYIFISPQSLLLRYYHLNVSSAIIDKNFLLSCGSKFNKKIEENFVHTSFCSFFLTDGIDMQSLVYVFI